MTETTTDVTQGDEFAAATRAQLERTELSRLAQSRQRIVREAIAKRGDVPLGLQAALANDDWHEVRASIAGNPQVAQSVLRHLATDRHHGVVLALIGNPAVPRPAVEALAAHKRGDVRAAALDRIAKGGPFAQQAELSLDDRIPELRDRVVEERERLERERQDKEAERAVAAMAETMSATAMVSQSLGGTHQRQGGPEADPMQRTAAQQPASATFLPDPAVDAAGLEEEPWPAADAEDAWIGGRYAIPQRSFRVAAAW